MGWTGGFRKFDNTVYMNSIIKFTRQIKHLPTITKSCSSALDFVHKQVYRVWLHFRERTKEAGANKSNINQQLKKYSGGKHEFMELCS
jgi:hypothetical protein